MIQMQKEKIGKNIRKYAYVSRLGNENPIHIVLNRVYLLPECYLLVESYN